jgi:hypothetical protein
MRSTFEINLDKLQDIDNLIPIAELGHQAVKYQHNLNMGPNRTQTDLLQLIDIISKVSSKVQTLINHWSAATDEASRRISSAYNIIETHV